MQADEPSRPEDIENLPAAVRKRQGQADAALNDAKCLKGMRILQRKGMDALSSK